MRSITYKRHAVRLGGLGVCWLVAVNPAWSSTFGPPLTLSPSDAQPLDSFGYSVAVNDQFAVVGSVLHDQDEQDAGTAYVFNTTTGAELFELRPSTPTAGAQFGFSVDVSGNLAIVGSPF